MSPPLPFSIWKSRQLTLILLVVDVIGLTACWFGAWAFRFELGRAWMGPINPVDPYSGSIRSCLGSGWATRFSSVFTSTGVG